MTQDWQNRMVTYLMYSSKGDLMLTADGDLAVKFDMDEDFKPLPRGQYRPLFVAARITRDGWQLTPEGATYMLENEVGCCNNYNTRQLRKIAAVAFGTAPPNRRSRYPGVSQ